MNFSVHFDDHTLVRLNRAVAQTGVARNRLIVRAVRDWLTRWEDQAWPEALQEHFGNPAPSLAEGTADFEPWMPADSRRDHAA